MNTILRIQFHENSTFSSVLDGSSIMNWKNSNFMLIFERIQLLAFIIPEIDLNSRYCFYDRIQAETEVGLRLFDSDGNYVHDRSWSEPKYG